MSSLIERVCAVAKEENAQTVREICVACGDVSGVIPDALEFCFDVCVAETVAEDAILTIEHIPAEWQCNQCGAKTTQVDDKNIPLCPTCHSHDVALIHGREFQLTSVIVE